MNKHVRVFKITKTQRVGEIEETLTLEYPVDIEKQLYMGDVINIYRGMIVALHEQEHGINCHINEENT